MIVLLIPYPSLTVIHPVPPPSLTSVPILELNCLISDDDSNHVFPVKIARTESVGTLKEAIKDKKKPLFDHITADALTLWNVSLAVDDCLKDNVSNVLRKEEALSPVQRLSALGEPEDEHVHIIVLHDPPTGE